MGVKKILIAFAIILVAICAWFWWNQYHSGKAPAAFACSNGRIEGVEIDIATRTAGRLEEIFVHEGQFVSAGQLTARMDTEMLEARLHEAQAGLQGAGAAVETAQSNVRRLRHEHEAARFVVSQREAEHELAENRYTRAEHLMKTEVMAKEDFDVIRAALFSAKAALSRARADVSANSAAIATAESEILAAKTNVDASLARIERLQAEIDDCFLKSPRDGRVQYIVARPGEILNAGGTILNVIDLTDVYMSFFLPTAKAGWIRIGTETRLVLDAAPEYVIPASVFFVADVAQFTPKTVETAREREKLMFKVKAGIDPQLLRKHLKSVKTGLPGMACVQLDPEVPWPERLAVRLPE